MINGRNNAFVLINDAQTPALNMFFSYYTKLGNGMFWVTLLAYALGEKKSKLLYLLIPAIIISVSLTFFLKMVVFPEAFRPAKLASPGFPVRLAEGVKTVYDYSFPSGHAVQSFCMLLLLVFIVNRNWCIIIFPLMAWLVCYSRVYLAKHFVNDVLAGMITGIFSAVLSVILYKYFLRKQHHKTTITT